MREILKFGERVEGFEIAVLNEREIRAGAGLLFVLFFFSVNSAILKGDFTALKYSVTLFLTDLIIRVLISPRFSPSLILGRMIVRNQTPEYVGAKQKKFAWIIGIVLASVTFIHLVIYNSRSPVTGLICLICLAFLFFETSFGICLGCKFYPFFTRSKIQYCPGEICDVKTKQEIQKISFSQILITISFIAYSIVLIFLFGDNFKKQPVDLLADEKKNSEQLSK